MTYEELKEAFKVRRSLVISKLLSNIRKLGYKAKATSLRGDGNYDFDIGGLPLHVYVCAVGHGDWSGPPPETPLYIRLSGKMNHQRIMQPKSGNFDFKRVAAAAIARALADDARRKQEEAAKKERDRKVAAMDHTLAELRKKFGAGKRWPETHIVTVDGSAYTGQYEIRIDTTDLFIIRKALDALKKCGVAGIKINSEK